MRDLLKRRQMADDGAEVERVNEMVADVREHKTPEVQSWLEKAGWSGSMSAELSREEVGPWEL